MTDPNIYQGPGDGGTHHALVNVAAEAVDNTGAADAGPSWLAIAIALVLSGQRLWAPAGTYKIQTKFGWPSKSVTCLGPATFINQQLTHNAGVAYSNCFIYGQVTGSPVTVGTINANVTVGQPTVVVTPSAGVPTSGNYIQLLQGTSCFFGQIKNVLAAGGGSYTITVDHPIPIPLTTAGTYNEYTNEPHDIVVHGDEAFQSGTGDQGWIFANAERASIDRLNFGQGGTYGLPGNAAGGFDLGCRECVASDMFADLTGAAGSVDGYYMQSVERSALQRISVLLDANNTSDAFALLDSYQGSLDHTWAMGLPGNSATGHFVGSLGGGSLGNFDCTMTDGGSIGLANGLLVQNSDGFSSSGYSALACTTIGASVGTGSKNVTLARINTRNCATGIQISGGSVGTRVVDHCGDGCTTAVLTCSDAADVDGCNAVVAAGIGPILFSHASGVCNLSKLRLTTSFAACQAVTNAGAGTLNVDNCEVSCTGGTVPYGYLAQAGTMNVTKSTSNVPGGICFYVANGATLNLTSAVSSGVGSFSYVVGASSFLHIGPGCQLQGSISNAGTVTMVQTGGVITRAGTSGTTAATFAEHYGQSIEIGGTSPIAAGACAITAFDSFIGQQFVVKNFNTGTSTTTVFGVVVPVLSTYLLRCNSGGVWEHDVLT